MDAEPSLLDEVDAFLARTNMTPTAFGRKAVNDGHFVKQLRSGRRVWPETAAAVRRFIHEGTHASVKAA